MPGGPAVKILCFCCTGHRFNPWSGNEDPTNFALQLKNKKNKNIYSLVLASEAQNLELCVLTLLLQPKHVEIAEPGKDRRHLLEWVQWICHLVMRRLFQYLVPSRHSSIHRMKNEDYLECIASHFPGNRQYHNTAEALSHIFCGFLVKLQWKHYPGLA